MRYFFAFLFFSVTLIAAEPSSPKPVSLVNLTSSPTSVVNGSVNVITGNYVESATDYVSSGPNPYILGHTFINTQLQKGNLGYGWNFYHNHTLRIFKKQRPLFFPKTLSDEEEEDWDERDRKIYELLNADDDDEETTEVPLTIEEFNAFLDGGLIPKGKHHTYLYLMDSSAGTLLFKGNEEWKSFKLVTKHTGFSNTYAGEISAKTNIKNMQVTFDRKRKLCKVYSGDGTKRYYEPARRLHKHPNPLKMSSYFLDCRLIREKHLNGTQVQYEYSKAGKISAITTISPTKKILNWTKFHYSHHKIRVETSDGHNFTFRQETIPIHDKKEASVISRIERPGLPDESFKYEKKCHHHDIRISKKRHADGYQLENSYFAHRNGKEYKYLSNRVSEQAVIFSKSQTKPTTTHIYEYHKKKHGGFSDVIDPTNNCRTRYHYNKEERLTCIEWFSKEKALLQKETYLWSSDGNLLARTLFDERDLPIFARTYEYDTRGNILKESLYGSITSSVAPIELDKKGLPKNPSLYRRFTYDDLNNTTSERDLYGNMTYYHYKKDSNLLIAKLSCVSKDIIKREFFRYDDDGLLITHITDDGSSPKCKDLTNVSHRTITHITPRKTAPNFSEPEVITEYYLDNGKEILLSKTVNSFNSKGLITSQELFDANLYSQGKTAIGYDAYSRVIYKKDLAGNEERISYDASGNAASKHGPRSDLHYEYEYDLLGRLTVEREVRPTITLTTTYSYDTLGRKITETNPQGHTTRYEYDGLSRLTKIIFPPLPNGKHPTKEYRYTKGGSTVVELNEKGEETLTQTNIFGTITFAQLPDKTTTEAHCDSFGNKITEKAPNGTVSHFTYDGLQRLIRADTAGSTKELHYNRLLLTDEIGAMQERLHFTYDAAGRKQEALLNNTKRTTYHYDTLNRLSEERSFHNDNDYLAKKIRYDSLNRPIEELLTDSSGTLFSQKKLIYDQEGNVTELSNGIGSTTTEYYPHSLPAKITDALGNTTLFRYNYFFSNSRRELVTKKTTIDPRGVTTEEIFNLQHLPETIRTLDPYGYKLAEKRLFYDMTGCLIKTEEDAIANNNTLRTITTELSYGLANRLERILLAANTPEQKEVRFAYNIFGQKEKELRSDGSTISYTYDKKGRLATQLSSDGTINYAYSYNAHDNVISVKNLLSGQSTLRTYDNLNNLLQETLENGATLSYAHDKLGRITTITYPDSSTTHYTYSAAFLTSISRGSHTYRITKRDLAGHILEAQLPDNAGTISYSYDTLGRCTSTTHPHFSATNRSFDPSGNLLSSSFIDEQGTTNSYFSYDYLSQLIDESGTENHTYTYDSLNNRLSHNNNPHTLNALHFTTHDTTNSYEHDRHGNRTIKHTPTGDITYHYDALDRLIRIEQDGIVTQYTYDAFHRRLSKKTNTSTERYLYILENEIGALDANNLITQLRVLGEGLGAEIGATVLMELSGSTYIPLHDLRGNIHTLLYQGSSYETYRYTAFGEIATASSNPWRLSGKRTDDESGLVYFGRRYYDPSLGKWLTQDPLGLKAGPNLYAYVLNNPLTHIDLYGLMVDRERGGHRATQRDLVSIPQGRECYSERGGTLRQDNSGDRRSDYSWALRSEVERAEQTVRVATEIWKKQKNTAYNRDRILELALCVDEYIQATSVTTSKNTTLKGTTNHKLHICYIGGMAMQWPGTQRNAQYLSVLSGGQTIEITHNETVLGFGDVLRCGFGLCLGFKPDAARLLRKKWDEIFDKDPDAMILQISYSEGGIDTKNELRNYPKERAQRIFVVAICPGGYIDPSTCADVVHYRARIHRDLVPYLDLVGMWKAKDTIVTLKSHERAPLFDHDLRSPTYEKRLKTHIDNFYNSNGTSIQ